MQVPTFSAFAIIHGMDAEYIHLLPEGPLPDLTGSAFRAVVIAETEVTGEWRGRVSDWLVKSGCLYMMAWGRDCSLWDDSVDWSNLEQFDYGDIPADRFVMTTWHNGEPLEEMFWFCEHVARHPTVALNRIILVHVSPFERKSKLLANYRDSGRIA